MSMERTGMARMSTNGRNSNRAQQEGAIDELNVVGGRLQGKNPRHRVIREGVVCLVPVCLSV
jgi:hypothetical protein